jgi:tetratricopeptide (TPR) repeat protein
VAGEAGIGKTRLLAAVASAARGRSFGVVRAAAFPGDSEASGGLLLDLASDLRAARDERAAEATAAMSAQLREPGGAGGDRHRRRRLLVQDLADAFGDLGGAGPLLVVLEDLHWADELSLEVVGHLAARLPTRPLLVAGAYRSDELYPRLPLRRWRARLLPQRLAEEIRLPRLDAAQTAALAGVLLGHPPPAGVAAAVHDIRDALYGDVPPGERRRLHRLVAAAAAGRGYGDAFVSAQFDQAGLAEPAYRHALAAAREASALSAHREALELYRRAERNLAADPDPREHAALLAAIGDEAAASDDNTAALAAYRQAHRLLAEAGAALDAAAVVARWSAVAHLLGEDLDTRAGRLEEALGSVPEEEGTRAVRAELLSGLAAAYMLDRQLDASIGYGERSLALAPADGDDPASLNTAATLGSVLVFAGRMDEGWAMLESAVGRAAEHRLEAEAARAYRMIGSCASVLVEYDRAERWLGEGVDYAERVEMWNHRHYMAAHLAPRLGAVGRGGGGGPPAPPGPGRRARRHHHPDHRRARPRVPGHGPRGLGGGRRAARRRPRPGGAHGRAAAAVAGPVGPGRDGPAPRRPGGGGGAVRPRACRLGPGRRRRLPVPVPGHRGAGPAGRARGRARDPGRRRPRPGPGRPGRGGPGRRRGGPGAGRGRLAGAPPLLGGDLGPARPAPSSPRPTGCWRPPPATARPNRGRR